MHPGELGAQDLGAYLDGPRGPVPVSFPTRLNTPASEAVGAFFLRLAHHAKACPRSKTAG